MALICGARRGTRSAGLVLAFALVIAACSSDDPEADAAADAADADVSSTTTEDATPPSSEDQAAPGLEVTGSGEGLEGAELEEFLARRYEAYWDVYDAARSAPTANPAADFPLLAELAAGGQLEASYQQVIELAEKGESQQEPETPAVEGVDANTEHRVKVELVDDTVAEISGCVVNDDVRRVDDTGAVVSDSVATVMSESTMALTDGEWKLIRSRAVAIEPGVAGCWLTEDEAFPY